MHHSPVIEFLLRGNDVVRSVVIEPLFPLAADESDLSVRGRSALRTAIEIDRLNTVNATS